MKEKHEIIKSLIVCPVCIGLPCVHTIVLSFYKNKDLATCSYCHNTRLGRWIPSDKVPAQLELPTG